MRSVGEHCPEYGEDQQEDLGAQYTSRIEPTHYRPPMWLLPVGFGLICALLYTVWCGMDHVGGCGP